MWPVCLTKAQSFPSLEADLGCFSSQRALMGDWSPRLFTRQSHAIAASCFQETCPCLSASAASVSLLQPGLRSMQHRIPSSCWGSLCEESGLTIAKTGTGYLENDWKVISFDSQKSHTQTMCWELGRCALAWESLSCMLQVQFGRMMGESGQVPTCCLCPDLSRQTVLPVGIYENLTWS